MADKVGNETDLGIEVLDSPTRTEPIAGSVSGPGVIKHLVQHAGELIFAGWFGGAGGAGFLEFFDLHVQAVDFGFMRLGLGLEHPAQFLKLLFHALAIIRRYRLILAENRHRPQDH